MPPINFADDDLLAVLEESIAVARSGKELPRHWLDRVQRLGGLGNKTYIAALGGALLARATDDTVDCLTHKRDQGPRAYQLRKTAEFLTKHNHGRYHLGATGRWPVNNSPFYGSQARIDEFTKISSQSRPAYELFLDCMVDLNKLSSAEAARAFAAYLRIRMAVAQAESAAAEQDLAFESRLSLPALLRAAEVFVKDDPEGGRRGQAFVAAVLDCVFDNVVLQKINSPHPGDVRVMKGDDLSLVVEVKQLPVDEAAGIAVARDAKELGAGSALLVVICDSHRPVDRERIRSTAARELGVAIAVVESVRELIMQAAVFGGGATAEILSHLPTAYTRRMLEHEVSKRGQQRWRELMEARNA